MSSTGVEQTTVHVSVRPTIFSQKAGIDKAQAAYRNLVLSSILDTAVVAPLLSRRLVEQHRCISL